jgi:hypothetical protein
MNDNDDITQNNLEQFRLDSFRSWTVAFIDPKKLALYGFSYIGPRDVVRCNFCRVEIGEWNFGDNVLVEHLRWSPDCPLLKRQQTSNIPINKSDLESNLPPVDCRINNNREFRLNSYPESQSPNHPDYTLENTRLKSFYGWPKYMKQRPKKLAEAGFFYTGKGDQVKCFSCGGGLKDWEDDDIPWEQHALFYEKCAHLNLIKGDDYIKQVKHEFKKNVEDTNNEELVTLCKVCFNKDSPVILTPCMHVVVCENCALSLLTCPICRVKILEFKRIFFA